jgi:Holliday junction resolvase-like predicted endonuclease
METTRKSFEKAVTKGEYGEQIVKEFLEKKGWMTYTPDRKNKAHAFDFLITKNKEKIAAVDVKSKARANNFRKTGINLKSYKEYIHFAKKLNTRFVLVFVDEHPLEQRVYGGDIFKIGSPDIINGDGKSICFWNLDKFHHMFKLTEKQVKELKELSQRNYDYEANESELEELLGG